MSGGKSCQCSERIEPIKGTSNRPGRLWRVIKRNENNSYFVKNRSQWSAYSCVLCLRCRTVWRTKATYIDHLPNATQDELNAPGPYTTNVGGVGCKGVHASFMEAMGREPYN